VLYSQIAAVVGCLDVLKRRYRRIQGLYIRTIAKLTTRNHDVELLALAWDAQGSQLNFMCGRNAGPNNSNGSFVKKEHAQFALDFSVCPSGDKLDGRCLRQVSLIWHWHVCLRREYGMEAVLIGTCGYAQ
jgi:hypothetical protein